MFCPSLLELCSRRSFSQLPKITAGQRQGRSGRELGGTVACGRCGAWQEIVPSRASAPPYEAHRELPTPGQGAEPSLQYHRGAEGWACLLGGCCGGLEKAGYSPALPGPPCEVGVRRPRAGSLETQVLVLLLA